MNNMTKIRMIEKVSIDIFYEKTYHNGMRYIVHTLNWFVNNVTQPGKNDKEEKQMKKLIALSNLLIFAQELCIL